MSKMSKMSKMRELRIAALEAIAEDMRKDASEFAGSVFNGKNVGEHYRKQCQAIETIADIVKTILKENKI